jgi:hypothetical protein
MVGADAARIYQLRGKIANPYSHALAHVQMIATLLDDSEQRILGYRVLPMVAGLQVGESIPVEVEIVPLVGGANTRHHVLIYGWND